MGKVKSKLHDENLSAEVDAVLPPDYGGGPNKKTPDRIVIGELESKRLDDWMKVVDEKFQGFIKVNKTDLVSFLIRDHNEHLSREELERIKQSNYDEGRFLTWAVAKWKESQKAGDGFKMTDIFEAYKTVFEKTPAKPTNKSKKEADKALSPSSDALTMALNLDSNESKS
ncbi:MAG: hypothetical protein JNM24_04715 [Bdellovibrionaceae bacterium]|nr:hypothetical protein [Pseudobdellovibrionaceae bacterium]